MTDQELIKALRYCGSSDEKSCRDCPAVKECHGSIGIPTATIAADRLEALLAENERLKQDMQVMKYGFDLLKSRTHTAEPPSTEGVE